MGMTSNENQICDSNMAQNQTSRKYGTLQMDPGENLKEYGDKNLTLFRSTPINNMLCLPPNAAAHCLQTPPEGMKVSSGFVPKIKRENNLASPGSAFAPLTKSTAGSAFSLIMPQPYLLPTIQNMQIESNKTCTALNPKNKEEEPYEFKEDSNESKKVTKHNGKEKKKKERNKYSARECRKRKKQYIEALEQQVFQLK